MKKLISSILVLGFTSMPISCICLADEKPLIASEIPNETINDDKQLHTQNEETILEEGKLEVLDENKDIQICENNVKNVTEQETNTEDIAKNKIFQDAQADASKNLVNISSESKEKLKMVAKFAGPLIMTIGGMIAVKYFANIRPKKLKDQYKTCYDTNFDICQTGARMHLNQMYNYNLKNATEDYNAKNLYNDLHSALIESHAACKQNSEQLCSKEYVSVKRAKNLSLAIQIGKFLLDIAKTIKF